jgi:hypothetical protein
MRILEGSINFIEDSIERKNNFWGQFKLQLEEIKVWESNCNLKKSIWSNQGPNYINIEVWWAIRDLIEEIQNQGPNWKRRVIVGAEIDQIRGPN